MGGAEHELEAGLGEGQIDASDHVSLVAPIQALDHEPDDAEAAAGETAGLEVGDVAELLGGVHHPAPGLGLDVGPTVQDPRDRRVRHAGAPSDVDDRDGTLRDRGVHTVLHLVRRARCRHRSRSSIVTGRPTPIGDRRSISRTRVRALCRTGNRAEADDRSLTSIAAGRTRRDRATLRDRSEHACRGGADYHRHR